MQPFDDSLGICPFCEQPYGRRDIESSADGSEVHAGCGAVLACGVVAIDVPVLLRFGGSARPLDESAGDGGKRVKRTPPIRARRNRHGLHLRLSVGDVVPRPFATAATQAGYNRIYHFHERIEQRNNTEVRQAT